MEYFTIFCQYQYSDYLDYLYSSRSIGVLTETILYQEIKRWFFISENFFPCNIKFDSLHKTNFILISFNKVIVF